LKRKLSKQSKRAQSPYATVGGVVLMMTRQKGKCKMKTPITKKAIMSAYHNVIKVGYCDMQDALKRRE
jgi:hypothetical protein